MKTRSNRLNNGYSSFNLSDKCDGIISSQKSFIEAEDAFEGLEGTYPYNVPNEWIKIPDITAGQQIFVGTYAIYDTDANFVAFSATTSTGNYLVDWGNGTTSAHASNAVARKQYFPSDYAGLTSSVFRNYKTLNITITPVTGNITALSLPQEHTTLPSALRSLIYRGWLNIKCSLPFASSITVSNCKMLENFECINSNSLTSCGSMFDTDTALRRVSIADTSKVTDFGRMFQNCYSLYEIPVMNTRLGTNFYGFAVNCYALRYIPYLDLQNAGSLGQGFQNCLSLKTIPPFNAPKATDWSQTFSGCYSLEYVPYMDTRSATNMGNAFFYCSALKKIAKLDVSKVTTFSQCFRGCFKLKTFPQWNMASATELGAMFFDCQNLTYVPDLSTPSVTSMGTMFRNCGSLKNAPNLNTSNVTNFGGMFFNCITLETVPNYNINKGINFAETFFQCYNLKNLGWTYSGPTAGLSTTAFNTTFSNCQGLDSLGFWDFSSATGSSYASVFSNFLTNTYSLKSVGFTGISQNIVIGGNLLGATQLNSVYTNLAIVGASGSATKTITVSNSWGNCAALGHLPSIAVAKGWQVTG